MAEPLYTVADAARQKGVSRQALHAWLQKQNRLTRCQTVGSFLDPETRKNGQRVRLWLVPASLLAEYHTDPGGSEAQLERRKKKMSAAA